MGNHNHSLASGQFPKRCLHLGFVIRVCKGGGLIQDQYGGIFQHGPGNGNALLLPAGQMHPLAADDGMDPLREFFNDVHALSRFQGLQNRFLRG